MISVRFLAQAPAQPPSVRADRTETSDPSVEGLGAALPPAASGLAPGPDHAFSPPARTCHRIPYGNALHTSNPGPDHHCRAGSHRSRGPGCSPGPRSSSGPHCSPCCGASVRSSCCGTRPHGPGWRAAGDHFQVLPRWGPATRFPVRGWSAPGGCPTASGQQTFGACPQAPTAAASVPAPQAPTAAPPAPVFRFGLGGHRAPEF